MKNFTLPRKLNFSLCLLWISLLLLGSCAGPQQHFSFQPAPPAYIKQAPVDKTSATAEAIRLKADALNPEADAATFTASTTQALTTLPEVAALKAGLPAKAKQAPKAEIKAETQKLTLAQKVVLKKLQKKAAKLEQKTKRELDTTAGPVSNRSAIALILIGLVLAIFGALLGAVFYTLGTLLVLIGLVLLILNYV